jgi:hypothetical protein
MDTSSLGPGLVGFTFNTIIFSSLGTACPSAFVGTKKTKKERSTIENSRNTAEFCIVLYEVIVYIIPPHQFSCDNLAVYLYELFNFYCGDVPVSS